jgi:hypothetical protein
LLSLPALFLAIEMTSAEAPRWNDVVRLLTDPTSEAKAALERGDRRFLAVQGFSTEAPGVEDFHMVDRNGIVIIDDTTDYISTLTQSYFKERARDYANDYNRYILEHASPPSP